MSHEHNHGHEHSHEHEHEHSHEHGGELKESLIKIIIAAVLFAAVLSIDKLNLIETFTGSKWLLALYIVPYLIVGYEVIFESFENIAHGEVFDEDFLMMVASIAAFAIGEYEEAVAVMLLFQTGELFEGYAVGKSRNSIAGLMDIVPTYANLIGEDGNTVQTDPKEVKVGSLILIRPGEKVPLDCEIIEGDSFMDTKAITGEPVPRHVTAGEPLYSGFINGASILKCRTLKVYEDSTVARILELVEHASDRKSEAENFVSKFARYYTPIVTIAAVLLAVIPSLITGEWAEWVRRACMFLVISCPCALVISVPLGFFGGIGAASRLGVLVKGSNFLEAVAELQTVAFDKTGTLTKGEFAVTDVTVYNDRCTKKAILEMAAEAEANSTHPIAQAIVAACNSGQFGAEAKHASYGVSNVNETAGQGIEGSVISLLNPSLDDGSPNHTVFAIGNEKLMNTYDIRPKKTEGGATVIYVALGQSLVGAITISDNVKENAKDAIRDMKKLGIKNTVLLTGDRGEAACKVADALDIDSCHFELMPEGKVRVLENLVNDPSMGKVAFVGDGINDAPVLMRADVGIAMGSLGSDSAIEAADVVIMDDDIGKIAKLVRIARKTLIIVKENIAFSLAVKFTILVLGMFGVTGIELAVFADVGVAMLAILNSMRTLRVGK